MSTLKFLKKLVVLGVVGIGFPYLLAANQTNDFDSIDLELNDSLQKSTALVGNHPQKNYFYVAGSEITVTGTNQFDAINFPNNGDSKNPVSSGKHIIPSPNKNNPNAFILNKGDYFISFEGDIDEGSFSNAALEFRLNGKLVSNSIFLDDEHTLQAIVRVNQDDKVFQVGIANLGTGDNVFFSHASLVIIRLGPVPNN